MTQTLDQLATARWLACKVVPYFSRGLWAMTFVESTDVPTLGISDSWVVYANPEYIGKCQRDGTLVGELIHEVLHPTLRHSPRARMCCATDHKHWNGAADAELDQRIEGLTHKWLKLVEERVRPEHFTGGAKGMTAEELYRLPRKTKRSSGDGSGCGGGSGATGQKEPWETKLGKGLTEAQGKLLVQQIAQDVLEYAQKNPGRVPGGISRWAEEYEDVAHVPWTQLAAARIAYVLDTKRGSHPSYARPSRRDVGGLVLPVRRSAPPKAAIVIDTSGSMGDDDIGKGLGVAYDACATLGRVWAMSCDAQSGDAVEITHVDDLKPHMKGGGGTNMGIGLAAAAELEPDLGVVVTDGDTPWPAKAPEFPVVVVLTREPHMPTPAWAEDVIRAF